MNVPLRPEFEKFINDELKAGRYRSAGEVLEAGLARLMLDSSDDDLDAEDIAEIEAGEQQIRRGEDLDWKVVSAELRRKYLGEGP